MVSLWGIIAAVAAALAVVATSLVITVCLVVAWTTDAVRGRPRPARDARTAVHAPPGSRNWDASGLPEASLRGER